MIRAVLRRLPAVLGILLLVTVMPAVLVLWTRWTDWPHVTWPPLHSGFLGAFEPADLRAWAVATYHEIRLSLGTDGLLLATCLLALWITWAVMLCCLAADTLRLLRYGAHRLRAHGPDGVRGWITALVTSTVLVSTASPSIAAAVPANPVAASAPRHPSGPQRDTEPLRAAPEVDRPDSGPSTSGPWLRTHRGDSLWELAKNHLGDGTRWREITDLNPHLSPEPQFLRAGDWLRLPDDAVHTEPAPLPDGVRWITVTDGDTLSSLAHQHLGDPDRWHEIFDLNRERTQDADRTLRRPGFLMPGWRLAVPSTEPRGVGGEDVTEGTVLRPPELEPMSLQPPPVAATPAAPPSQQPNMRGGTPFPDHDDTHADKAASPGVVVGLSAAGVLSLAALVHYQFRRRHRRRTRPDPLPVIYPLSITPRTHETRSSWTSDDEPHRASPSAVANPPASAARDDRATEDGTAAPTPTTGHAAFAATAASGDDLASGEVRIVRTAPTPAHSEGDLLPGAPNTGTEGEQVTMAGEAVGAHSAVEPANTTPVPEPAEVWELEQTEAGPARAEPLVDQPRHSSEAARVRLAVFGPVALSLNTDAEQTPTQIGLQPRMRALLIFLALHPHGTRREELLDTLWGERGTGTNALNTTVSRLRRALAAHDPVLGDLVTVQDGRYRLNPDLATVDYWEFTDAVQRQRQAATDDERAAADEQLIAVYSGEFATGLDAPWTEPARAHAYRAFLDTVTARTNALQQVDPHHVLGLLETARDLAPHHEPLYRNIMRLQARLGLHEAIPATLALLHTRLADLDTGPDQHTRSLAEHLVQHQHT